ncbi:hypothetical protein B0H10DRAFT_77981 [Mycena sp. CBHHK59/15]|nr:hypothetical protein B0H10DRAFT_77981 [Mycena sp. CBHHK59/15]
MAELVARYVWAILSPSAHHSVAYFKSALATSAAADLNCGQYLAVVEPSTDVDWDDTLAYLVQPSHFPLPDTYLPILPCRLGSREPLVPDFEWPFGECIIDTSHKFIFKPVVVASEGVRRVLSDAASRLFSTITDDDDKEQWKRDTVKRLVDREAAGLVDDDFRWTTFSRKSTAVDTIPGQFFPPSSISAQIRYDIESLKQILPMSQCFDEVRKIEILRARFSRPETEWTILWTLNHVCILNYLFASRNGGAYSSTSFRYAFVLRAGETIFSCRDFHIRQFLL